MRTSVVTDAGVQKMAEKLRQLREEELRQLREEALPKVVEELAEARSSGDLEENSDYAEASWRQQVVERRIAELEAQLRNARTVQSAAPSPDVQIVLGATVVVTEERTGRERRFKLVGSEEADVTSGLLSVQSPLGRALIGAQVGETVTVEAPAGAQAYTVLEVQHLSPGTGIKG